MTDQTRAYTVIVIPRPIIRQWSRSIPPLWETDPDACCYARVWNGGCGGRCSFRRTQGDYCKTHFGQAMIQKLKHGDIRVEGVGSIPLQPNLERALYPLGTDLTFPEDFPLSICGIVLNNNNTTPVKRNPKKTPREEKPDSEDACWARVWNAGTGGRCRQKRVCGDYCKQHHKQALINKMTNGDTRVCGTGSTPLNHPLWQKLYGYSQPLTYPPDFPLEICGIVPQT